MLVAPQARKVQLQPNIVEVNPDGTANGLGQKPYDMLRDHNGVWTVTTPPVVPGFHYYHFVVDGLIVNDPGTEAFTTGVGDEAHYGIGLVTSGVEVPEKGVDFYLPKNVPHGAVQELWYFSKVTSGWRHAYIYTPPDYDVRAARYPVLYLQHGGAQDETGWVREGHVSFIMDNLLAEKKIVPMLVVMEYGYAPKLIETAPKIGVLFDPKAYRAQDPESRARFEELMIRDLIPTIDARYRTIPDREHRAIAGLSRGAAQALQIGFDHLETFASIGAFSGGSAGHDFKAEASYNGILTKPGLLNSKLRLLWVGDGTAEPTYQDSKGFHEALQKLGIKHAYYESPGTSHEWLTWRRHLYDFAPRLFRLN